MPSGSGAIWANPWNGLICNDRMFITKIDPTSLNSQRSALLRDYADQVLETDQLPERACDRFSLDCLEKLAVPWHDQEAA